MAVDIKELHTQLHNFAVAHYEKDATISHVEVMPGHSGLSFGFRVDYHKDGQNHHESLVMRLPPKGVRQSGNTDVLRQVPLLQTLKRNGVPVPNVRWSGDNLRWEKRGTFVNYENNLWAKAGHCNLLREAKLIWMNPRLHCLPLQAITNKPAHGQDTAGTGSNIRACGISWRSAGRT